MKLLLNSILIIFFVLVTNCVCIKSDDADNLFAFAQHLQQSDDSYRAITEYRRFIFYYPDDQRVIESQYRIGECYLLGEQFESAAEAFSSALTLSTDANWRFKSDFALAKTYFISSHFQRSFMQLNSLKMKKIPEKFIDSVNYSLIWCHLKTKQPQYALDVFNQVLTHDSLHSPLGSLLESLQDFKFKKPWIAGALSAAVPGAGQLYAGRPRDAWMSFVLNSLFIGCIVYAVNEDHNETAALMGFFELGFYSANIYNSINITHKENERNWEIELEKIRSECGSPFQ